jgi:cysteine-rich repeat protein
MAVCALPTCGDGFTQLALEEACDDGNVIDGDGCEGDCTLPVFPGLCTDAYYSDVYDNNVVYDANNSGDALDIRTP